VKLSRVSLLLALFAFSATGTIVGGFVTGCDSSGGVGPGGTCFLLSDCQEGLFCLRPDASDNGTCANKGELGQIQPPSSTTEAGVGVAPSPEAGSAAAGEDAGAAEDAALMQPMDASPDSAASPDTSIGTQKDAEVPDRATPPEDASAFDVVESGTPEASPADASAADTAPTTDS
jgi:hypothetical protein